ncbi:metallophosphoesterase [uncultured Jatrophihabitans sp.]|uniref:metallophosphoesterase n=1 Tax=uncultured Jatrophihabitans sp. TaxID=1610747 RepID=UPI0035CC64B7
MPSLARSAAVVAAAGAGTFGYAAAIERNAFTLRRFDVPVLAPGATPIRVLHLSDLHITAHQRRKLAWISSLARLEPDLVVNTGDTLSGLDAAPAVLRSLAPLFAFPGVFVPGNNDYYAPRMKSPVHYFWPEGKKIYGSPMPWPQLASAMTARGWTDLTHVRTTLEAGGVRVALAGTDDPHLRRARYELIAGPAEPDAAVRIGVTHSPEPFMLAAFARDGYDVVLAGHTHGGQVRVPFGPAIVTNCGIERDRARWLHQWDERMWFHICAGLGTNPFAPVRFACRPEATLLTLTPRG